MRSIIKLATIAFDETSNYWSAPKSFNFSAFHWSPHGCLITIGQHFVTTRVVHLPKRTETSLITESDQSRANHQLLQLCTVRTAWSDSDQAVRAVHSCKSWIDYTLGLIVQQNIILTPCVTLLSHLRDSFFISFFCFLAVLENSVLRAETAQVTHKMMSVVCKRHVRMVAKNSE